MAAPTATIKTNSRDARQLPADLVLTRASVEGLHGVDAGPWNPRARIHPAAVHAHVQAARSHAEAGTVQTEVQAHAGRDAEGSPAQRRIVPASGDGTKPLWVV